MTECRDGGTRSGVLRDAGGKGELLLSTCMDSLGKKKNPASCGAARVPAGPARDFKIEGWLVGTEAGGQGGKAARPLTTETCADGTPEIFPGTRLTSPCAISRPVARDGV